MLWILGIALGGSIIMNVVVLAGLYGVHQKTKSFIDYVNIINIDLEDFVDHLEYVHGLERYYGDETLIELIQHVEVLAKDVRMLLETGINADEEMAVRDKEEQKTEED